MRRVLLPEADDPRVWRAAEVAAGGGRVLPVLLGERAPAGAEALAIKGDDYADLLRQKYAGKKELTNEEAAAQLADPVCLAALALASGAVDGVVAGATRPTADVVRAGLRLVGCAAGVNTVSGFFVMRLPKTAAAAGQSFLFADCALVAEPTAEQLADIALATAANAVKILRQEPVVAMLSFSTLGSAQHPAAQKVAEATALVRARAPQLQIAGEVQADAALHLPTAQKKGAGLQKPANVLIFPDLNSGNIGYKLVQRLAGGEAVGPALQGLAKPFNDLSRGAEVADIVALVELTAQQAGD